MRRKWQTNGYILLFISPKYYRKGIPATTQLFTTDWIVRYMVDNSLGRMWLEGHENEELKKG